MNVQSKNSSGFTLIEVVLAIGVFLISILALVGLLGPTLSSVDDVTRSDETVSVVNTVNSFLMNSPDIRPDGSRFNAIYEALHSGNGGVLTIFVYRRFATGAADEDREELVVGFASSTSFSGDVPPRSRALVSSFDNLSGPVYRVLLTASSVLPGPPQVTGATATRTAYSSANFPPATLTQPLSSYPEGYLAMEVRVFAETASPDAPAVATDPTEEGLANREPIFTYNMAIVR